MLSRRACSTVPGLATTSKYWVSVLTLTGVFGVVIPAFVPNSVVPSTVAYLSASASLTTTLLALNVITYSSLIALSSGKDGCSPEARVPDVLGLVRLIDT